MLVAGIDEAGRGAVAGPVVAGACVLTTPLFRRRHRFPRWSPRRRECNENCCIADSKLLSPDERDRAFTWITAHCPFGIGIADVLVVEERGILFATHHAMLRALEDLRRTVSPSVLHVDGRDRFRFPLPHRSIIRGDLLHSEIAAASIIAKVTRDRFMREQGKEFPLYGFERHKGYGTPEHMAVIAEHGVCPLHRKTFLRPMLEHQEFPIFE